MSSKRKEQTFYTPEYQKKRWSPKNLSPHELKQLTEANDCTKSNNCMESNDCMGSNDCTEAPPFDKELYLNDTLPIQKNACDCASACLCINLQPKILSSSVGQTCEAISSEEAKLDSFPFMDIPDAKIQKIFEKLIMLMHNGVIVKLISGNKSVYCNARSNLPDIKFRYVLIVDFSLLPELFTMGHPNNKTQYLRDNEINMKNWDGIAIFAQEEILSRPITRYTL
jgi:hypothetical protein